MELKDILSKARVAIPSKANKADLIAKVLASPDAMSIFHGNTELDIQGEAPQATPGAETSGTVSRAPFYRFFR